MRFMPLLLATAVACAGSPSSAPRRGSTSDGDVIRYRLKLRHNSVDPGEAFRCYGRCQAEATPRGYVECLAECPGFEVTPGAYCAKDEVPPLAACLMVRRVRIKKELDPAVVVLAVIGEFALVVALASLCASSGSQCGYGYRY